MNDYAYNYENSYDELMHYGVKGMRWGIRHAYKKASKATTSEARIKDVNNMLIQIGRKYVNG